MLASRTIARQAKTTTATVASKKTASRGQTIVRKNSKGGEEGARAYNNDAFGMIAKAASYSLFGAAITKVRRRVRCARARSRIRMTPMDGARRARFGRARGRVGGYTRAYIED
mmetsp:Transcript_7025/g.15669  ORF Transcript_7025/g.15669 Transcript_7025/m.15669 type:complete len:113 (-) Transcript_7025:735-1073(-)